VLRALIIGGTSATGDVLVAADGASSAVRQQYLPHARVNDAGIVAIGGKVAVTTDTTALLQPECFLGLSLVFARPRAWRAWCRSSPVAPAESERARRGCSRPSVGVGRQPRRHGAGAQARES